MKGTAFSLLSISLLAPRVMAECVFADISDKYFEEIIKVRDEVFNGRTLERLREDLERSDTLLEPSVLKICPSLDQEFLSDPQSPSGVQLLEIGGSGAVFRVTTNKMEREKAVKIVRFSDY